MEPLSNFHRKSAASRISILTESIKKIKFGLITRLHKLYSTKYEKDTSQVLATCVIKEIFLEDPSNKEELVFQIKNRDLIDKEIAEIYTHDVLRRAVFAAYTAELICTSCQKILEDNELSASEREDKIVKKAANMRILITEIIGSFSNNPTLAIAKFAEEFWNQAAESSQDI